MEGVLSSEVTVRPKGTQTSTAPLEKLKISLSLEAYVLKSLFAFKLVF